VGASSGAISIYEHDQPPGFVADPAVLIGQFDVAFQRLAVEPFRPCSFLITFQAHSKKNSNRWISASRVRSVSGALRTSLKLAGLIPVASPLSATYNAPTLFNVFFNFLEKSEPQ